MKRKETEGRRLLLKLLTIRTQAWLAEQLGPPVLQWMVSRWASGDRSPPPIYRLALEILFGIPVDAWWTDEELAVVARARERASLADVRAVRSHLRADGLSRAA